MSKKTLNRVMPPSQESTSCVETWGYDLFKLLSKAWSHEECWMKSTKAMDVPGGVVIQVSTQQGDNVAEALTFVPGVRIHDFGEGCYELVECSNG